MARLSYALVPNFRDRLTAIFGKAAPAKLKKFVPTAEPVRGTFGVLELPARSFTVHRAEDGSEVEIARSVRPRTDAARSPG